MAENGVPKKMGLNIDLNSRAPLEEDTQDQASSESLPLPIQMLLEQQRAAVGLAPKGGSLTIREPMEQKNAEMKFPQRGENKTSNLLRLPNQVRAKLLEQRRAAVGSAPLGGSLTIREPPLEPKNAKMVNVKFPQQGENKTSNSFLLLQKKMRVEAFEQQAAAVGSAPLGGSLTIRAPMEPKNAEMVVKCPLEAKYKTSKLLQMTYQSRAKLFEQQRAAVGSAHLGGSLTISELVKPKNADMASVKFSQQGENKSGITTMPQIPESANAALRKRLEKAEVPLMTPVGNVAVSEGEKTVVPLVPPPLRQHKEFSLSCPICMGKLVEETSTKCGHIFCKSCIDASLSAQRKCPTCSRKLRVNATFRIYLTTDSN